MALNPGEYYLATSISAPRSRLNPLVYPRARIVKSPSQVFNERQVGAHARDARLNSIDFRHMPRGELPLVSISLLWQIPLGADGIFPNCRNESLPDFVRFFRDVHQRLRGSISLSLVFSSRFALERDTLGFSVPEMYRYRPVPGNLKGPNVSNEEIR